MTLVPATPMRNAFWRPIAAMTWRCGSNHTAGEAPWTTRACAQRSKRRRGRHAKSRPDARGVRPASSIR